MCYGYNVDMTNGNIGSKSQNNITNVYSEENNAYINPYASFKGKIIRDGNDVITAIYFEQ